MQTVPKKYEIKLYHKYRKEFGLDKDYEKRDKMYRDRIQKTFFYSNDLLHLAIEDLRKEIIKPIRKEFNKIKKFLHIK